MKHTIALLFLVLAFAACAESPTATYLDIEPAFAGIGDTGIKIGDQDAVTPSTNEANKTNGWAYVEWNSDNAGVGEAPLKFLSSRNFLSCFEYRIDGASPTGIDNHNPAVTDGLWPFVCVNNSEATLDLTANTFVDIRMVFGAEGDERFDWTRYYVMTGVSKDQCMDGGWQARGFVNQGHCIRFAETGKDSRESGIFGGVTWTSGLDVENWRTVFAVNAVMQMGTIWSYSPNGDSFTMSVECAVVIGTEAWAGGTVIEATGAYESTHMGKPILFYAQDMVPRPTNLVLGTRSPVSMVSLGPGLRSGTVTEWQPTATWWCVDR